MGETGRLRPGAGGRVLILLLVVVLKVSAREVLMGGPESGFADELDLKYGSGGEDVPAPETIRKLIKFEEDSDFRLPKLGETLELGKDEPVLGLSSPNPVQSGFRRERVEKPVELGEDRARSAGQRSRGTLIKAVGSFTISDWIVETDAPRDVLAPLKQKAIVAAADLPALIELGEQDQKPDAVIDDLTLAQADALANSKETTDLGSSDEEDESEKEQPRRPGWQHKVPGIDMKVAAADFLIQPDNTQTASVKSLRPKSVAKTTQTASIKHSRPKSALKVAQTASEESPPLQMKLLGCYQDQDRAKALPVAAGDGLPMDDPTIPNQMSPQKCADLCHGYNRGYTVMGLQTLGLQSFCYCGRSTGKSIKTSLDKCNVPCAGAPELKCGAELHMSVFVMDVKTEKDSCWTGKEVVLGLDPKRPWERYRRCAICDGTESKVAMRENWQEWGEPMGAYDFAACLSCDPLDVLVVTDPKRGTGFCTSYAPETDKVVSHVYPYYAHWDGRSDFTHTKYMQKLVSPNMREGKAVALCRLWKQITCFPNQKALRQVWDQYRQNSVTFGDQTLPQQRYLECTSLKTIKCNTVCLKTERTHGVYHCGKGGRRVQAFAKDGLKDVLGKGSSDQAGNWCCYNNCQVPRTHGSFREDGSFWCKEAAMLL